MSAHRPESSRPARRLGSLMPVTLCLALLSPLSAVWAEPSAVEIDTPIAGWRVGSKDGANFTQEVNYPASSISVRANQAQSARIMGRINSTRKSTEPDTLIINGISMPLQSAADGRFDRPFSFSSGSNSVEVRSSNGEGKRRVQFFDNSGGTAPPKLRVLLSWDTDNTDLDLHLVTPDGAHIWYGNRVAANGAALDIDVTTGYGPEIIAMPAPQKGNYLVYVNYYGGGYSRDDEGNVIAGKDLTVAKVTLVTEEGTPDEKQESFIIPMRVPGELTLIKRFSYP